MYQRVVIMDNVCNKITSKWVPVEHGAPQGSLLGPLLFLIYINDLSRTISSVANPVLFANDTSIIITNIDIEEFRNNIDSVMKETINWFKSDLLTLNCEKTHFSDFFYQKTKWIENSNSCF